MSIPVIAFFNNKGGVGKTSLAYHLSWKFSELDVKILAADLDPQANLSAAFLSEDRLEEIWIDGKGETIFTTLKPLIERSGVAAAPSLEKITSNLSLIVGDIRLSDSEDMFSSEWPKCLDRDVGAFRVLSSFWTVLQKGAEESNADLIIMDVGPNLGAINRAALIATDYVIIPVAPDLFSIQGLQNLGPTLKDWRRDWQERLQKKPNSFTDALPEGKIAPMGYIVLQHGERLDRPVKAYQKWIEKLPAIFHDEVLIDKAITTPDSIDTDPHCLAMLKHYRSLVPMAQQARKPVFQLKASDGAIGSHQNLVKKAGEDFQALARTVADRIHLKMPSQEF